VFEVVATVAMAMFAMLIIGLLLNRPLLMVWPVPRAYLMR